jgi:hypothetical protein
MKLVSVSRRHGAGQGAARQKSFWSASLSSTVRLHGYSSPSSRHSELTSLFQTFAVQLCMSDGSPTRAVMPGAGNDMSLVVGGSRSSIDAECSGFLDEGVVLPLTHSDDITGDECPITYDDVTCHDVPAGNVGDPVVLSDDIDILWSLPASLAERSNTSTDLASPGPLAGDSAVVHTGRAPVSEAELCVSGAVVDASAHPRVDDEPRLDEAAMRDMRRRMRNRASAARSNARRKERHRSIRQGLASATRRASELRNKETELRAENMALRRSLVGGYNSTLRGASRE